MNFMISMVGWFLWNWAEFSISKERGDGFGCLNPVSKIINDSSIDVTQKADILSKINEVLKKPLTLVEYAATHYETWIGSIVMTTVLLWAGSRQLDLAPFEAVTGAKLGWNDVYLLGSGAAWDAFIFGFKKIKSFFKKKDSEI